MDSGILDLLIGSHDGYAHLDPSMVHQAMGSCPRVRVVSCARHHYGADDARLDISWHMGPDVGLWRQFCSTRKAARKAFALFTVQGSRWTARTVGGVFIRLQSKSSAAATMSFGSTGGCSTAVCHAYFASSASAELPHSLRQLALLEASTAPAQGYSLVWDSLQCDISSSGKKEAVASRGDCRAIYAVRFAGTTARVMGKG